MSATVTSSHERLQTRLQSLLGPRLAVVCSGVDGDPRSLWPQEVCALGGAVARRQREFAAGRAAARQAMRRLTGTEAPVPSHQDRSPVWPVKLVGSIAHSRETCVAVVGQRGDWSSIGIDLETDQGLEPDLWPLICTAQELSSLEQETAKPRAHLVTRYFVAKEAFYKWHYPLRRTMLGFQDVHIRWLPDGGEFNVYPQTDVASDEGPVASGRLWLIEGQLIACCATPAIPGDMP